MADFSMSEEKKLRWLLFLLVGQNTSSQESSSYVKYSASGLMSLVDG